MNKKMYKANELKENKSKEDNRDFINHPPHYTFSNIEVIDVIEDFNLPYHLGNVIKYIARFDKKGSCLENIRKAIWYLERYKKITCCDNVWGFSSLSNKYSIKDILDEWKLNKNLSKVIENVLMGRISDALKMLKIFEKKLISDLVENQ